MKRVFLEVGGRTHSLYNELVNFPPDGYAVETGNTSLGAWLGGMQSIEAIRNFSTTDFATIIPPSVFIPKVFSGKVLNGYSLTYCSGHVQFRDGKWVTDVEYAAQLAGYNLRALRRWRNVLRKRLLSDSCLGVLPWTDACRRTLFAEFRDKAIRDKIRIVRLSCPPVSKSVVEKPDATTFLFVSSVNFPHDFESKGGREVIMAFRRLEETERDVRLVVRARAPEPYAKMCRQDANITLIDAPLPWSELSRVFASSDVFLFPGHVTPGKVILDAMSHGLPVIGTDVWGTREMITPENGILLPASRMASYYIEGIHPNWPTRSFRSSIRSVDHKVVAQLSEAMTVLHRDPGLREALGNHGRIMTEDGEFSLRRRNSALAEVFSGAE